MPKHEVALGIDHEIAVGDVDVRLPIKADGKPLGRVQISQGGVDWLPSPNSKTSYELGWEDFDRLMRDNGTVKR